MRTTVNVHDGLLETAKRRAQERGTTLGDLVEEALRRYLVAADDPLPAGPPLPVFRGRGGLRPGIDPTSNASLYDAMDAEEDAATAALMRREHP